MLSFKAVSPLIAAFIFAASGCGKYVEPLPPERFAPKKVRELEILPTDQGVTFKWKAPEKDARGVELESLDGYRVYRRQIVRQSDIVDTTSDYDLLSTIPDTHVVEREKLRAEARAKGKPARRINVDTKNLMFEYSDASPERGKSYLYQIVPINQGDVESGNSDELFIAFDGINSKISKVEGVESDESETDAIIK